MRVKLSIDVCHDVDNNSTTLRARAWSVTGYDGDGTEVEHTSMRREFLWDDTHEIGVRCAVQKAMTRWAEQLWAPVDSF